MQAGFPASLLLCFCPWVPIAAQDPLAQAAPQIPSLSPSPAKAAKWLTLGPQRPPCRMEAWPCFKGTLVLYNLSAGDNSQAANEGEWGGGLHPAPGSLAPWAPGLPGFAMLGEQAPPQPRRDRGTPQWVPFCAGMFWGCPKVGAEPVSPCTLLWGHRLGAPPQVHLPRLPRCTEIPGAIARPQRGEPGVGFWGALHPHGLRAPRSPACGGGSGHWGEPIEGECWSHGHRGSTWRQIWGEFV